MQSPPASASVAQLEKVERYLAADPGNALLLRTAVDLCLSLGRFDVARRHVDAARQSAPDDAVIQHQRGNVLIAQGQLDEAAQVFEALLRQVNDVNIAFNLAFVRYRQQRFADGREVLAPFVKAGTASSQAVTLFVKILHHLGELSEALEIVKREMPRCSADPEFLGTASLLLFDNDQLEDAQRSSSAALASGARPLEALVVAGSLALGRDEEQTA